MCTDQGQKNDRKYSIFCTRDTWHSYQATLSDALEARDISFHLSQDIAAENVDYIVYAPSSDVQDFTPLPAAKQCSISGLGLKM